ncbi:TPA: shufflon system plasmid conjugative transfer pilus tip adhesin PilV [Kluyvera ascorbata]|nr:shufflon system plasmid conjugative transfer pilus tip adhesin PilV [Kluyvera ascorbata]
MKKNDRGWAQLDFGMTLVFLMVIVAFIGGKIQDYVQEKNWQMEAARTDAFAAASRSYAGRNYSTLLGAATTTSPAVITVDMLKNTGFLPASFSATNSRGQLLQTYIIRNNQSTEMLQGMIVASGGTAYPLKALITMAKTIKTGFGGYIENGQTITGALRAWHIPLAEYGAVSGNGHLAVMLSANELTSAQEDNDRLYRFQVNGRPDLNTMHTAIDMDSNNINNAGAVNAVSGNFSGDVQGTNGNFTQNLTAGGQVRGDTIQADTDIVAGGQITGTGIRANGNLSAGGVLQLDQVNISGVACYPNGMISRDAAGGILSCQSGAWAGQAKMNILTVNGASSCTNSGAMIAVCPADTFVISGSYQLTAWGRKSSHNSPDAMFVDPVNNRFVVNAPTNNDTTCFRAIATCAKFQ